MESTDIRKEELEQSQKDIVHLARQLRFKKRLIQGAIFCVVVLAVIGTAWFSGHQQAKQKLDAKIDQLQLEIDKRDKKIQELIETPIVVSPVKPEISLDMIYSEIKNIGELASIEYLFTDSAKFSDSKQIKNWNIPLTEKSFILKWNGIIKAGIKLEQVKIEVIEADKLVKVVLPAAEILSYQVDNDSIEVLDEQNNLFNSLKISDKVKFDAATEKAMKQRAIENGLLEKAQKNAQDILSRLLLNNPAIKDTYKVTFSVA